MATVDRINLLLTTNIALLQQGRSLLESIEPNIYTCRIEAMFSNRIGAQVRHILEFYECFLHGVPCSYIDYDARRRDPEVEASPQAAIRKLNTFIQRLSADGWQDDFLRVRMEDAPPEHTISASLSSSVSRELQMLISHTVHHYALIAMALRILDVPVDPAFGVAPSTIRYQQQLAEVA